MKVATKISRWEHEPWTIVTQDNWPNEGEVYYAYNTRTGERRGIKSTYERALASIEENPHAEPWGV